jgi:predicted AAA+ superfamily ATPase
MIKRILSAIIEQRFFKGKVIILLGPRQAGKTTLLEYIIKQQKEKSIILNADEADIRELLTDTTSTRLKSIIGNNRLICIDEAQRIDNIGLTLKLFTDMIKDVQVIASGSSAFDLANRTAEPLTGRKYEFLLLPLSFDEMVKHHGLLEEKRVLEHRLIYGYYPEIVTKPGEEKELLKLLAESYLYRDLLSFGGIKKPALLEKILQALALQVGNEVSFTEIGQLVRADNETVERYIDLLEKTYVIFRLPALSRNIRNEIKKGRKIYFYDNGIRNAIISNFNYPPLRSDIGALWENFLVSERKKYLLNIEDEIKSYFWRTTQQQEIDYIEEQAGKFTAYEFKWNPGTRKKFPQTFLRSYPVIQSSIITPDNFEQFLI